MGLGVNTAKWLLLMEKKYKMDWSNVLTFGRQYWFEDFTNPKTRKTMGKYFDVDSIQQTDGYGENFFRYLSNREDIQIDSLDYSAYEGANIIHDLNYPISQDLYNSYSLVIDIGTVEHVFNIPEAIFNIMRLVKRGGYAIVISPANDYLWHGFWQVTPEVYKQVFSERFGFELLELDLGMDLHDARTAFRRMPDTMKERKYPHGLTDVCVIARKTREVNYSEILESIVQGEYEDLWDTHQEVNYSIPTTQRRFRELLKRNKTIHYIGRTVLRMIKTKPRRTKLLYYNIDRELDKYILQ